MFNPFNVFVALLADEKYRAAVVGDKITDLQSEIDREEKRLATPDWTGKVKGSQIDRLCLDNAKQRLADARAEIGKPSKSKFGRKMRLLEASDLVSEGRAYLFFGYADETCGDC